MRILAVDDDPIILEILKELLSSDSRRQVTMAESAEAALSILKGGEDLFDLFLLDIQMPGMDGITLCQRIRALPQYARTPILMLTAMHDKAYIDRSFAAGASDYITKPFEPVEVEARVRTAEQIVEERRRAAETNQALTSLRRREESAHRQPLSQPFTMADVDGMIEPLAFENYLLQLGRVRQFLSSVIAVKVANIVEIHQQCSGRNFRYFLEDMADALADSLMRWQFLMCYLGNGVFVIAVDRRAAEAVHEDLKTSLPAALNEIAPLYDSGAPIPIDIAVGAPCYPGLLKGRSVPELMQMAVDDAENRALHPPQLAPKRPVGLSRVAKAASQRPDATAFAW